MPKQFVLKSLTGVDWKKHFDHENKISFTDFFETGEIVVGDIFTVQNKNESGFPLQEAQYSLTFSKTFTGGAVFFTEEPFYLEECKLLFGPKFDY
ncbi:hypothetical protein ACPV3A_17075 [Paenibacillus sp. Dod16]|uniref:hypothetical protein n=1 Tax=Paenibacillus sp. Dod16 TaxID=3416392 RepID=UPI003CFA95F5